MRVKRVLRDRLLRALGMAGNSGKWQDIADAMDGVWDSKRMKSRLDAIVDRRNAIVHEGATLASTGHKRRSEPARSRR